MEGTLKTSNTIASLDAGLPVLFRPVLHDGLLHQDGERCAVRAVRAAGGHDDGHGAAGQPLVGCVNESGFHDPRALAVHPEPVAVQSQPQGDLAEHHGQRPERPAGQRPGPVLLLPVQHHRPEHLFLDVGRSRQSRRPSHGAGRTAVHDSAGGACRCAGRCACPCGARCRYLRSRGAHSGHTNPRDGSSWRPGPRCDRAGRTSRTSRTGTGETRAGPRPRQRAASADPRGCAVCAAEGGRTPDPLPRPRSDHRRAGAGCRPAGDLQGVIPDPAARRPRAYVRHGELDDAAKCQLRNPLQDIRDRRHLERYGRGVLPGPARRHQHHSQRGRAVEVPLRSFVDGTGVAGLAEPPPPRPAAGTHLLFARRSRARSARSRP